MAGPLPAPDPPPQNPSSHLLQAKNPLTLPSSNQIQENPSPLLLRPSDPSVRWSDPAATSSDQRPLLLHPSEPAGPAPVLALRVQNLPFPTPSLSSSAAPSFHASAPACPSPELAQLPAAPEQPPAVPPVSAAAFPPLSNSLPISPHHAEAPLSAQRADLQKRLPPVRRNAQVNPPHLKSYAQAAKGSPAPGFVRAHARDVNSFARLPRTGINVICGTREDIPVFSLVQSDMHKVEGLYAKALVMKFHGGRPSLAASHKEISSWGLESSFSIGPLTSRSFLLRFQEERDLMKILTRPSSTLITFPYKIFRWHSRCHKNEDSGMVPVWISLPRLPLQCFAPEFLESIANRIGRFLCLDKATATLARPSTARMCIELDLRKARPQCVLIDLFEGHRQPIVYERLPKFCMGCHMQGHSNAECSKPQPNLQSSNAEALHPPLPPTPSNAKANNPPSPLSAATVPPCTSDPPPSSAHSPSSEAQRVSNASPAPASTAAPSPTQSLSAQAAPFSPSDPVPSMQHTETPAPSSSDVVPQQPPPSLPSNTKALSSPCSVGAVPPIAQKSISPHIRFPAIKLMPRPHSTPVRSNIAVASPAAAHPLHQPSLQQPPPPSLKAHSKHRKSVSFKPQQSNIQANQDLWDVVNRHIDQINKARLSPHEGTSNAYEEPPDPSYFPMESDSGASVETDFLPNYSVASAHEDENPPQSYVSEGEELNVEPISLQGHISDDAFYQRPKNSKRNKRHPDGPLKVQLRARKGSSSIHR